MNLGLGNLDLLKKQIMPSALESDPKFDAQLQTIGAGVAGMFEAHCNRAFGRAAGQIDEFSAGRTFWVLRRLPVETVTKIEQRDSTLSGWQDLGTDAALNFSASSGIIQFGQMFGPDSSQIRITYTGGYWFETLEPTDMGYPSAMPAGATPVPPELQRAWLSQCLADFQRLDAIGKAALADKPKVVADLEMLPAVERVLNSFRRFAS